MSDGKVLLPPTVVGVGRRANLLKMRELRDIIGAARLGARPETGTLPTAKGLALHDGSGGRAIDITVAGRDALAPVGDFFFVERMQSCCQTEIIIILNRDGLVQAGRSHQAQDGAETFGAIKPGA